MTQRKAELLAPAGSWDSMVAAVQSGADAVYFGTGSFNARASAANFTGEAIEKAIDYCHSRGVLVNITMNTLLLDKEMEPAMETARHLRLLGADALIVQDTGLIALLRREYPDLPLHASTQMTIHNAEGVRACQKLGMSRVVLAREVSLEEIRAIRKQVPLELEAFVHGAMCVSVSGQCLFSSFVGCRSGNRGACAQPCRMKYEKDGKEGYLLSMKDLCMLEYVRDLTDAGIFSLKIEGRMKRPEYVAAVTSAYRRALDGEISDFEAERRKLMQVFHRGGFSQGYYYGRDGLVAEERPGHWGLPVGKAQKGRLYAEKALSSGDELAFRLKNGDQDETLRLSRDIPAHTSVRLPGLERAEGRTVFRTADALQLAGLREQVRTGHRSLPVSAVLRAEAGKPLLLRLSHGAFSAQAEGSIVEPASRAPSTEEKLRVSLAKLGDTPFSLERCEISLGQGAAPFIPASQLNELRRRAASALEEKLILSYRREDHAFSFGDGCALSVPFKDVTLIAQTAAVDQARAALEAGAKVIYCQPRLWNEKNLAAFSDLCKEGVEVWPVLPPVLMEKELRQAVSMLKTGTFSGAVASNIGQIALLREVFPRVAGDYPLNIANRFCAKAHLDMGLCSVTLSPELTLPQIRDIISQIPAEIIIYGRIPMMHLLHCPTRRMGNGCAKDCFEGKPLIDRRGYEFTLLPLTLQKGRCDVQILNSLPLDGLRVYEKLRAAGTARWRMLFALETSSEVRARTAQFCSALSGKEFKPLSESTAGHFLRGV